MKDYSEENSMVLNFDDEYIDPYDRHEISYDEARQNRIDELKDVIRDIGMSAVEKGRK